MKHLWFCFFLIVGTTVYAQSLFIKGQIKDSSNQSLSTAMVLLLSAKDSVMHSFTTSDDNGAFKLEAEKSKNYLLQVSFLGMETYWQKVDIANESITLDPIHLIPTSSMLPSIEVVGEQDLLKISKDTVEYNTKAFKVQPGAAVEDLLKKLPGLEVQRDGSVKAYGEDVKNVLVDGKEFFGKDTRMATKNLDADAVDKVQVFDKKSDMAEFTGIDDGNDEKTINLKLKANRKNGYFGNAEVAGGTDERFKTKFNINRFSPGNRLSLIGTANNINEQTFSMNDYIDFMGGMGALFGGGGRIEIGGQGGGMGLPMNTAIQGLQRSIGGGFNYNKTFSPKTEFTMSYMANGLRNVLDRSSDRQSILNESFYNTIEDEERTSGSTSHNTTFRLRSRFDSSLIFTLRGNAGWNTNSFDSDGLNQTISSNVLANSSQRLFHSKGNGFNFQVSPTIMKRFKKAGRNFTVNGTMRLGDTDRDGILEAVNKYLTGIPITDSIHQNQFSGNKNMQIDGRVSYTEPIGNNKNYIEISGSASNATNNTFSDFFDIIDPFSEVRNNLLSNAYNRGYQVYRSGLKWIKNSKDFNLSYGVNYQSSLLNGVLNNSETPIKVNYTGLLPEAHINYNIRRGSNWGIDYMTNIQEPSLQQLQPTVNNSDPLNIYVGNPQLKPAYIHMLQGNYFMYDQFSFTSLFANFGASYINNRITDLVEIDAQFRRTITPVNVDFEKSANGNIEFGTPIKPLKITSKLRLRSQLSQGILFVNAVENTVNRFGNSILFSIENRKKNKIDALAGIKLSKSNTRYSVTDRLDQEYNETNLFGELSYTPTVKWLFKTEYDYISYTQSGLSDKFTVPLWTASINKYLGKENKLMLTLSAFDLLNKNQGISRNSALNYQEVVRTNALGRYFMLGLKYSMRGLKKRDGIEINFGNEKR